MIITLGEFYVREDSKVEVLFNIDIRDQKNTESTFFMCCTNLNLEWSCNDGPERFDNATLLYSVYKSGPILYVNGIHYSSVAPLIGQWLKQGDITLLTAMLASHFQCDAKNIIVDRKDPYVNVITYIELVRCNEKKDDNFGNYSLHTWGNVSTVYEHEYPLLSVTDNYEGLFFNKWVLQSLPSGLATDKVLRRWEKDALERAIFD